MTVLSNVWVNPDGLAVKFGAEEGAIGKVGSLEDTYGEMQVMSIHFDYTDVASAAQILDYTAMLTSGSRLVRASILCETAATGTNAVLNVGLIKEDFSTAYDADGLIAAVPLASIDAAGETYESIIGATYVGSSIGTTLTEDAWITVDYDTAAFTAGKWVVTVFYYKPVTT